MDESENLERMSDSRLRPVRSVGQGRDSSNSIYRTVPEALLQKDYRANRSLPPKARRTMTSDNDPTQKHGVVNAESLGVVVGK